MTYRPSPWLLLSATLFFAFSLTAQPLRLMSYNIRLDVASDGENAWPKRCFFLNTQIQFYEPDILGIQEGLPHQVLFLKKNLGNYAMAGIGREGEGKGEASTIFYRAERFLLEQDHTFWLSPTPDSVSMGWDAACLRVCTAVLLKDRHTKRRFWVFNTHLDHMGEQARVNGMGVILSKMKSLNPSKLPVVLMGDFNCEPGSAVVQGLNSAFYDTRAYVGDDALGPEGTFNGFQCPVENPRRIDYIFFSRDSDFSAQRFNVLTDSRQGRYPSDHFPVFVQLSLPKK